MTLTGSAYAFGAGTIVNAIATLKGCAFAIDLKTYAEVELANDLDGIHGEIEGGGDTSLMERSVTAVLKRFNRSLGGSVRTTSEIPIARGLKSSSAAANASVLATLSALGEKLEPFEIIHLGVRAALDVGVSITGAFDDASASLLGGIVITNNEKMELIKRVEKKSNVLVFIPNERSFTSDVDVHRIRSIAPWVELAYGLAIEGDFEKAMTLNGFLYSAALGFDSEVMMMALERGVKGVGLSGTGSAFIALVDEERVDEIEDAWSDLDGYVIRTKINNKGVLCD